MTVKENLKEVLKEQIDDVKKKIEENGDKVIDTLDPLYVNRAIVQPDYHCGNQILQ